MRRNRQGSFQSAEEQLQAAARQTWDTIGGDLLIAKAQCTEGVDADEPYPDVEFTKAEVVELVMDANHIEAHGGMDYEGIQYYKSLSRDERLRIVTEAFECDVYGW